MYIYEETLTKVEPSTFSDPIHILDGTRIYKPFAEETF